MSRRGLVAETDRALPAPSSRHRSERGHQRPSKGWKSSGGLSTALFTLALGAGLVAVLGPLVGEVIRYHVSPGASNQIVGGDVAGLLLVAPMAVIAAFLVIRGHRAGPVLALGPALYGLYMYSQLALGGDILRWPGNSERFFPLFLGLFLICGFVAARAWREVAQSELPAIGRRLDRALGTFLLVVATFLTVGLHLPGLVDAWQDQPVGVEYLADPGVFWLVKFMDLGLVVPGLVLVGVALLGGRVWDGRLRYAAASWAALLGSSVAGMAVMMQVKGDPGASAANTTAFGAFALIALIMAWLIHRPLFGNPDSRLEDPEPESA